MAGAAAAHSAGGRRHACKAGGSAGCMHALLHHRVLQFVVHILARRSASPPPQPFPTPPIWRPWLQPPACGWQGEPSCSRPGRRCRRLWWQRRCRRCCHGAELRCCARQRRRPGLLHRSEHAHHPLAAVEAAVEAGRAERAAPCGRQVVARQQTPASCASTRCVRLSAAVCCALQALSECMPIALVHGRLVTCHVCAPYLPALRTSQPTPALPLLQAIASAGVASRRGADELIFEGKVSGREQRGPDMPATCRAAQPSAQTIGSGCCCWQPRCPACHHCHAGPSERPGGDRAGYAG